MIGGPVEPATRKVIHTHGAMVGVVEEVRDHPNGQRIWLALVRWGTDDRHQIVFGGGYELGPGELVPVAPPGSRITVESGAPSLRVRKMRARRYRGERSHGMLCSLAELGWVTECPDEVATLRDLPVGASLDEVPAERRVDVVAPRLVGFVRTAPRRESAGHELALMDANN